MPQTKIRSVQLSSSGVTSGSYTSADITIDSSGRVTAAANGAGGGGGTVTTVSVVSANGFAGTVATDTTTPAITLTTSITGVLKGNATAISAATSGTDYSLGTSALGTGIVKSTTGTGALTIAVAGDFPTLNQNTSGTAAGLSATLVETSGGTNQSTYATGDTLYASAANTLSKLAVGTAGQVLTLAAGVPTWATPVAGAGDSYALKPVRVATTANGTLASAFSNGNTVDSVVLATSDRILLKNQSTGAENGVYTVNASGAPTRVTDFTTGAATLTGGAIVTVIAGTINGGNTWRCANTTAITIGVTSIVFKPLNGVMAQGINASTASTATGTDSIAFGSANTATSDQCIAIGTSNNATGARSIAIGRFSTASGFSSISIGPGVIITGTDAIGIGTAAGGIGIAIGAAATANGADSYAIGRSALAAGTNPHIIIGSGSSSGSSPNTQNVIICPSGAATAGGSYCTGIGGALNFGTFAFNQTRLGSLAYGTSVSEVTFGTQNFASPGDAGSSQINLRASTTDATLTELGNNSTVLQTTTINTFFVMENTSMYVFNCDIIARQTSTGDSKAWNLTFAIKRGANAAATALVGTVTKTVIGADAGAAAWDVDATADTTGGRAAIKVTGELAKTIRWLSNCRITKISG